MNMEFDNFFVTRRASEPILSKRVKAEYSPSVLRRLPLPSPLLSQRASIKEEEEEDENDDDKNEEVREKIPNIKENAKDGKKPSYWKVLREHRDEAVQKSRPNSVKDIHNPSYWKILRQKLNLCAPVDMTAEKCDLPKLTKNTNRTVGLLIVYIHIIEFQQDLHQENI